jgi:hypothetical protein
VELLQFLTLNLCGFDPGLEAGSTKAIISNLVRGCSQTTLTSFWLFDQLPPSSCKCSLWTTPNLSSALVRMLFQKGNLPIIYGQVYLLAYILTLKMFFTLSLVSSIHDLLVVSVFVTFQESSWWSSILNCQSYERIIFL